MDSNKYEIMIDFQENQQELCRILGGVTNYERFTTEIFTELRKVFPGDNTESNTWVEKHEQQTSLRSDRGSLALIGIIAVVLGVNQISQIDMEKVKPKLEIIISVIKKVYSNFCINQGGKAHIHLKFGKNGIEDIDLKAAEKNMPKLLQDVVNAIQETTKSD